ncbi:MAG: NAD(P)-dependent alcohol dehydrogenase [Bacillota bacterium]|nr:NAD(P)-dependent alcohol dehydrogenase [Bacillota bacterium]
MKAVVYDKSNFPDTLVLRELEKPIPDDNEVLVKIFAVSVNAADYRSMKLGIIPKGKIFGADIAGRIEAVGKNIKKFKAGDEVFGDTASCGFGGFAEYVSVTESVLVLKPMNVPFETAAAVPMAAVTALQALRDKGNIQPKKKVLVCGAGGGVGTFAVQLAKYYGAEVTAVCGEKNVEVIQSLGADHVINYNKEDFTSGGKRYDLVLAVNGKHSLTAYKRVLAPKGIVVMVGGALSQILRTMLFGGLMSMGNKKMQLLKAKSDTEDLKFIIKLVEEGKVKPVIDRCYPLNETPKAVKYLSEGHAGGKVVINVKDCRENLNL